MLHGYWRYIAEVAGVGTCHGTIAPAYHGQLAPIHRPPKPSAPRAGPRPGLGGGGGGEGRFLFFPHSTPGPPSRTPEISHAFKLCQLCGRQLTDLYVPLNPFPLPPASSSEACPYGGLTDCSLMETDFPTRRERF